MSGGITLQLPELVIADLKPRYPIIQGGMAVRVSTAPLAGAVAKAGGIGVIGATGMSLDELRNEIRQARAIADGGIIGVNIMFAAQQFAELVHTALDEGIDVVFTGAGFSREVFVWGKEAGIPIVSIVSSAKAAVLAEKCGSPAVVAEGAEAGGHLGTHQSVREIVPEIVTAVKIPVIAAGGITNGRQMAEMVRLGASGVQMSTRFVLSEECTVADEFKQMYLNANADDVIIIESPVGLPGRALRNKFTDLLKEGQPPRIEECVKCLKKCSHSFCIIRALINASEGRMDSGLVFSGQNVHQIKEILPVSVIFERILEEYAQA